MPLRTTQCSRFSQGFTPTPRASGGHLQCSGDKDTGWPAWVARGGHWDTPSSLASRAHALGGVGFSCRLHVSVPCRRGSPVSLMAFLIGSRGIRTAAHSGLTSRWKDRPDRLATRGTVLPSLLS